MCLKCNTGCTSCDYLPSNCSTCGYDIGSNKDYFLQPTSLTCSLTCPTGYFAQSNNKCQKCTNGKYGDWVNGTTVACSLNCDPACAQCFNNNLNSCTACKNNGIFNFFLQPSGSTICSTTCPEGYYGNANICQLFSMCSSTCQASSCSANMD